MKRIFAMFILSCFILQVTIFRDKVDAELEVDGAKASAKGRPGPTVVNGISHLYFGGYYLNVTKAKINVSRLFRIKPQYPE